MRSPGRTTHWDGVRNFTARNFMRDGMKKGDQLFFYHSSGKEPSVVGICEVVREGYPDGTALDPAHDHHDPRSRPDAPSWYMVDVRAVKPLERPVTLAEIKRRPELANMALVRIGRLSVTPVTESEWHVIQSMSRAQS
jgi:predicted RNA-binding protein with PUA-like domain